MSESILHLQDRRVGDIAALLPGASAIFRQFDIEFCCQGHVSLSDAVNRRNLDLSEVKAALSTLDPTDAPEPPQETGQLIDHIQIRYHDVHRRQIPILIILSRKVESTHVNHPHVPAGLAQTLQSFLADLEECMQKQETAHFTALREKTPAQLALSISHMRHDHNEHAFFLDQIERLTDNFTLPEDACSAWQALYADLARFKADLIEHIHFENNILFPRIEAATGN